MVLGIDPTEEIESMSENVTQCAEKQQAELAQQAQEEAEQAELSKPIEQVAEDQAKAEEEEIENSMAEENQEDNAAPQGAAANKAAMGAQERQTPVVVSGPMGATPVGGSPVVGGGQGSPAAGYGSPGMGGGQGNPAAGYGSPGMGGGQVHPAAGYGSPGVGGGQGNPAEFNAAQVVPTGARRPNANFLSVSETTNGVENKMQKAKAFLGDDDDDGPSVGNINEGVENGRTRAEEELDCSTFTPPPSVLVARRGTSEAYWAFMAALENAERQVSRALNEAAVEGA